MNTIEKARNQASKRRQEKQEKNQRTHAGKKEICKEQLRNMQQLPSMNMRKKRRTLEKLAENREQKK
jgi:hypothetical protein